MTLFESPNRFGWLAMHLMSETASRLGTKNNATGTSYDLDNYFPVQSYFSDRKNLIFIVWNNQVDLDPTDSGGGQP